jgi:EAL domain-containing protein (putative c-di-GMP-specific phosphodiesterase class I)
VSCSTESNTKREIPSGGCADSACDRLTQLRRDDPSDLVWWPVRGSGTVVPMLTFRQTHAGFAAPKARGARPGPTRDELADALDNDLLEVHYQPIVDLRTDVVIGLEALVRWPHPAFGLLSAAAFIDEAEACGLVGRLDDWVLATTCRQIDAWERDVLVGPGFRVAVNISGSGLADEQLGAKVRAALADSGADPMCLTIELTESVELTNVELARTTMCSLREIGVRMALDDFGAAYATFERLRHLPFDSIKIDKDVTWSAEWPVGEAFVVAAVDLGRSLGMSVVAEGIETVELADLSRRLGCDYGQGYLWAGALSPQTTGTLLETGRLPDRHRPS